MPSTRSDLEELLAFNDWANRRLHDALADLSDEEWTSDVGGSFGTLQATVAHMVGAEWIWLQRWEGESPSSGPDWLRDPDAAELARRAEELAREREAWMSACTDEELEGVLSYQRLGGEPSSNRLDVLVRHVVNHATYHRGQVMAFLRNLGKEPPSTDLVLWDRLRSD